MSFNPYAPPEYNPDNFSGGGGDGPVQAWGVEEVLRQSWEIVKVHWVALIFGPMIGGAIANVPAQLVSGAGTGSKKEETIIVLGIVGAVLSFFIQTYFTAGVIQMTLTAARGGVPQVMQVFQGGSAYGRLLGTSLLSGLAVLLGFILLIVPGIIFGLGFSLSGYYAVDAGKGPIEAMRASWNATNGHKGQLFLYGLLCFVLSLVGLAACCIGIVVVQAVASAGMAIVYTRLSGRMAGSPASPFGGPPSPFGGGPGFTPGGPGAGPTPPPGGGWGAA